MTTVSRTARHVVALIATASLLLVGALPAQAATPFTVQGQVAFPEGYDPADAVHTYLLLMPPTGNQWIRASVASDGKFSATAPDAGNYTLHFYDSSATLFDGVVTADGSVSDDGAARVFSSDATITVTPRLSAVISGRIILPDGYDPERDGSFDIVSYVQRTTSWVGAGVLPWHLLEDDGTFEYRGLEPGTAYRFELRDYSKTFLSGYYGGGSYVEDFADSVSVVAPGSGVVFTPPVASTITGRLTAPNGTDLAQLIADGDVQVSRSPAPDEYPEFPHHRRAEVARDGTFTFRGLWPGNKFYVAAWAGSDVLERGMVDAAGALTLDTARARTVTSGDSGVNITMRRPDQFSGTVEFPDGFRYDAEAPPTVRPLPSKDEVYSLQWSSRKAVPVGPDGSFTTERAHSQTDFRLALTWPDGSVVYWTSNDTVPTADVDAATLVRPGTDIVLPNRNRLVNLSVPRIEGEALFGSTLRADGGTWAAPTPKLGYQWLRNGKVVAGATSASYPVTAADVGSRLAVTVTASAPGFTTQSATSAQTGVVGKVTATVGARVLAKGTTRSKVRLKVTVGTAGAVAAPTGTLQLTYGAKTRTVQIKAKHQGERTIKVPRTKARGRITVHYTPTGTSAEAVTAATGTVKVAKAAPKVKVKAPKKASKSSRVKVTVRVRTSLGAKPAGKVTVRSGSTVRTVRLTAKAKGTITVRLPRLAKGKHTLRATFAPAKKWRPYLKKSTTTTTLRVR